jgi:hypothetical protein
MPRPAGRLAQGPPRATQPAAVGTARAPMSPSQHTPQQGVAALLPDPAGAAREGPHLQPRVALTDGAEARPPHVMPHVPADIWLRDSHHATASRGDPAHALRGEPPPHRRAWGRADLEPRLAGPTAAVITALATAGPDSTPTAAPRQAGRRTVGYARRHRPYRRDEASLAHGWPMGTGVVEGAGRHLVNDRLEPSGMRWTNGSAQGVLDRRAVRLPHPWQASGPLHRHHQHQRRDGPSAPARVAADAQALARTA